jgi:hypothetical protein
MLPWLFVRTMARRHRLVGCVWVTLSKIVLTSTTHAPHMHLATSIQSIETDRDMACAAPVRAAFKELYLVSGAAAQLAASGQPVPETQWLALARAARNSSDVLGARREDDSEAIASFRRLADLCEDLLARRALGHTCPPVVWRDVVRAGRDTYEQIDT